VTDGPLAAAQGGPPSLQFEQSIMLDGAVVEVAAPPGSGEAPALPLRTAFI
jgi:hypothetical protein